MNPARLGIVAIAGSTILAFAAPASAQIAQMNYGWSAWHGCWHADGAPAQEVLCIVPDGDAVRMITVVNGAARDESRVVADDQAREVVQDACRGTQRAHWSNDRRRVFLNSELTCGDNMRRVSSGLMAFTDESHWLSVQAVTVDGQTATRSTRYTLTRSANVPDKLLTQLSGDQWREPARMAAAGDISEDEVSEAGANIDDAAVQEWLHASGLSADVASGSALDQINRDYDETRVVERPVYVERTYVTQVVRSCWDPFFGGFVVGGRHLAVGVGLGNGCGYRYYTRYSPWGYDLYGWRAYRPLVVVNRYPRYYPARPVIIHRGPSHYDNYRGYRDRRDYRDNRTYRDNRDNGSYRDNRDNNRNWGEHLRLTREGYTNQRGQGQSRNPSAQPSRAASVRVAPPPSRAIPRLPVRPARDAVSRDRRER